MSFFFFPPFCIKKLDSLRGNFPNHTKKSCCCFYVILSLSFSLAPTLRDALCAPNDDGKNRRAIEREVRFAGKWENVSITFDANTNQF